MAQYYRYDDEDDNDSYHSEVEVPFWKYVLCCLWWYHVPPVSCCICLK